MAGDRIRLRFTVSHVIVGEMRHHAESVRDRQVAETAAPARGVVRDFGDRPVISLVLPGE